MGHGLGLNSLRDIAAGPWISGRICSPATRRIKERFEPIKRSRQIATIIEEDDVGGQIGFPAGFSVSHWRLVGLRRVVVRIVLSIHTGDALEQGVAASRDRKRSSEGGRFDVVSMRGCLSIVDCFWFMVPSISRRPPRRKGENCRFWV